MGRQNILSTATPEFFRRLGLVQTPDLLDLPDHELLTAGNAALRLPVPGHTRA